MTYPTFDDGPWEMTPEWHPWRWLFGLDVRFSAVDSHYAGSTGRFWCYGRSQKVARELLRQQYGEEKEGLSK